MPSDYGIISKAIAKQPPAFDKGTTLDLYVLSYNQNKKLANASTTLKNNLKTYLNQYRMIGDTIAIKDAFIINIGIDFEIITDPEVNNSKVIRTCLVALQAYFNIDRWQINQPIVIKVLEQLLDNVPGVQTVKKIKFSNKVGISEGFSEYAYDIDGATQSGVIYPSIDPMIFEIKNPNRDIKGKVVNL